MRRGKLTRKQIPAFKSFSLPQMGAWQNDVRLSFPVSEASLFLGDLSQSARARACVWLGSSCRSNHVTRSFELGSVVDLRQAEVPVHLQQKTPGRQPACSCPAGGVIGRTTEQEGVRTAITDLAGPRAVGCAAGGSQVPGSGVYLSEQRNLSYETSSAP